MPKPHHLLAVLVLLAASPALAEPKAEDTIPSQPELNAQEAHAAAEADRELNKVYRKVTEDLTPTQRQDLTKAELAWMKYRDADKAFIGWLAGGGQATPMAESGAIRSASEVRMVQLNRVLDRHHWMLHPVTLPAAKAAFKDADARLNTDYKALMAQLKKPGQASLLKAQLAWLRFRDAEAAFEQGWRNDSAGEAVKLQTLARLTAQRDNDLQGYLIRFEPETP